MENSVPTFHRSQVACVCQADILQPENIRPLAPSTTQLSGVALSEKGKILLPAYTASLKVYHLKQKHTAHKFLLKSTPFHISVRVRTRRFRPVLIISSPKAKSSMRNSVHFKKLRNNFLFSKCELSGSSHNFIALRVHMFQLVGYPHIQRCPFCHVKEKISFISVFLKSLL